MTNTPTPTFTPTWTFTPTCVTHVWPDPFNPIYAFDQALKVDCLPDNSTVSFYTVSGELVASVGEVGGRVEWKGKNQTGAWVSPGVYYYMIQLGSQVLGKGKFLVAINQ